MRQGVSILILQTSGYSSLSQKERNSSYNRVSIYFRLMFVCFLFSLNNYYFQNGMAKFNKNLVKILDW